MVTTSGYVSLDDNVENRWGRHEQRGHSQIRGHVLPRRRGGRQPANSRLAQVDVLANGAKAVEVFSYVNPHDTDNPNDLKTYVVLTADR